MRVPSRRLPPYVRPTPSPVLKWGCLLGLMAGAGIAMYLCPLGVLMLLGIMVPTLWLGTVMVRRQRRIFVTRLKAARQGDALCRFAREFDCRTVDTWLIRATYEEVQEAYYGVTIDPVPVHAEDRWKEDLRIHDEDLDDIGWHVAQRAGYDMDDFRHNPLYGKVKTVRDLVAFMRHQPCTRVV